MDLDILQSRVSDNFFYGLVDDGEAALIDPVDGSRAVDWVRDRGVELRYVVNTHFHQDHTGGNPTVLGDYPGAELVVSAEDADRIAAQLDRHEIHRGLGDGDQLELGEATLDVFETPGHTPGHVSLQAGDHLFSGDTIFVAGAGNCSFGGDPGTLFRTFRDVLPEFDDDVTFFPGHDYAVRDLEFVLEIEPDNDRAASLLEEARSQDDDELFLTTLGDERDYSPFLRFRDGDLQERLAEEYADVYDDCASRASSRPEATFRTVRKLRNRW